MRVFVISPDGEVQCVEAAPGVEEAYELMVAAGVPPQQAADMAVAVARDNGEPVAFARHYIKLRAAARKEDWVDRDHLGT